MNEITGYIEMPFHGEKGESAYEIAQKHGYTGTEAEWVESLGFIPDKSIGEEKLKDALVSKLKKYEKAIGEVFDEEAGYGEIQVNEYTTATDYIVPYRLIGSVGAHRVRYPKLTATMMVFDEKDDSMWSAESGDYRLSKIDVSGNAGEKIKIYGVANSLPAYPCAFCTDENGTILARYGEETNTVYGYTLKEGYSCGYSFAAAIETIVPEKAKFLYIMGRKFTTSGTVVCDAVTKAEAMIVTNFVPKEKYALMQSPLWGKKLYVDGDSICYGNGYKGGFGKIIADRYNMEIVNAGVGGATISSGVIDKTVVYGNLDWVNNSYYLRLDNYNPVTGVWEGTFSLPITEDLYDNGYGKAPVWYRSVDGVMVEQSTQEERPSNTKWYLKFDVPGYDGNTTEKWVAMWQYDGSGSETTGSRWLWEAYKTGFKTAHQNKYCTMGTLRHCLSSSVEELDTAADYIIFEGGLNDYLMNKAVGTITEDMSGSVDIQTMVGGLERICRYLLNNCAGKKTLFVITHKVKNFAYSVNGTSWTKATLTDYHDAMVSVLKKYAIPYVDLFESSAFCTAFEGCLSYTVNNDGVHPTKEGYEKFYVPQIVSCMESI